MIQVALALRNCLHEKLNLIDLLFAKNSCFIIRNCSARQLIELIAFNYSPRNMKCLARDFVAVYCGQTSARDSQQLKRNSEGGCSRGLSALLTPAVASSRSHKSHDEETRQLLIKQRDVTDNIYPSGARDSREKKFCSLKVRAHIFLKHVMSRKQKYKL